MKKRILFGIILVLLVLNLFLVSAGELRVTQEHPFLVNGEWISASELKVGDKLTTSDGKIAVIKNIKDVFESVDVFNLEANAFSNFVLEDGIVVHNSDNRCLNCPRLDKPCIACGGPSGVVHGTSGNYLKEVTFLLIDRGYRGEAKSYILLKGWKALTPKSVWRECGVRLSGKDLYEVLSTSTENPTFRKIGIISYKDSVFAFPLVEETPTSLFKNPTLSDMFIAILREDGVRLDAPRVYSMYNLRPRTRDEILDLWRDMFSPGKTTFMRDAVFFEGQVSKNVAGKVTIDLRVTGYPSDLQNNWGIKPPMKRAFVNLKNAINGDVEVRHNIP